MESNQFTLGDNTLQNIQIKLHSEWEKLSSKFCGDKNIIKSIWTEILSSYTSSGRYYHNLFHLDHMFNQIAHFNTQLKNREAVLYAVWFHDIVYSSSAKDNEEKSADLAMEALTYLNAQNDVKNKVYDLIMATKSHYSNQHDDFDMKIFLDADLAILGGNCESYKQYYTSIRKEYKQYPDILYNHGRKKVLHKFLNTNFIYKTEEMRTQYESLARRNISLELKSL